MATTRTTPSRRCETRYFGPVDYDEGSVIAFPDGIPAFEREKRFLALRQPISEPLVFLQSLANPNLCFATLPALAVCPGYRLRMAPEDVRALGLEKGRQPAIGRDVLCLAILSVEKNAPPTVNLLAPIVVNVNTLRGRQAIQTDSRHSHREVLPLRGAACL
ncbi:MAG TPA: flagellar assembly protein FliW [Bryobacteraceae bacterium]|jgi:flagellar assembly factor FliW|nr:flagellar assembly protein FliW [Bryobacteraceae bacterium]